MMTFNRVSSFRMMEYIHETYPDIKQLIGGVHATIMHRQIIEKYPFAIAVLAEGEATTVELIRELCNPDCDLTSIKGITFSKDGTVITTENRDMIHNLDEIPFPKHELFFQGDRTCGAILTTRGCPSKCSFCCLNAVSRGRVRMRSIGNIMDEIESMIKKFPKMNEIWIHDDTFFVDNERVINFCDEIIKRKIKINFSCNARVKPVSKKMVDKLVQANFKRVYFGIESGSSIILEKCHKGITQADVINAFKLFADTNIHVASFLIIGLPGETEETVLETITLLKELQKIKYSPNSDQVGILKVFPGTEVYEIAKAGNFISDDYWLTDKPIPIFALENSIEQLERFKDIYTSNMSIVMAFCTWRGFKAQLEIIPHHLSFLIKNPSNIKFFLIRAAKFILPENTYQMFRNASKKLAKSHR